MLRWQLQPPCFLLPKVLGMPELLRTGTSYANTALAFVGYSPGNRKR